VFFETYEDQFSFWKKFRSRIEKIDAPLEETIKFWTKAPLVNKHLDAYRPDTWPDPWQIIKDGKYNDLTIAIMMGHTLKLTNRFKDCDIEIKQYLDMNNKVVYNTCVVDNKILNYQYGEIVVEEELPKDLVLQMAIPLPNYK
jgi:hypothetical protein